MEIRSLGSRGSVLFSALSLLAISGCSKAPAECARAVAMFRETLKSDQTLASVPDSAISLARAHKGETVAACILANGYADDAEKARQSPSAAAPAGSGAPAPVESAFVAGTPRVHFEITPPPRVESPAPSAPSPTEREIHDGASSPVAATATATATAAPAGEDSVAAARAACLKGCESVWGIQPKVACEQRCNGATPLPGATSEPVIVH